MLQYAIGLAHPHSEQCGQTAANAQFGTDDAQNSRPNRRWLQGAHPGSTIESNEPSKESQPRAIHDASLTPAWRRHIDCLALNRASATLQLAIQSRSCMLSRKSASVKHPATRVF